MDTAVIQSYRMQIDSRLQMWDGQIRLLESHLTGEDSSYRIGMVTTLRRKWQALGSTLTALKSADDTTWEEVRGSVEYAFLDLQRTLDEVREMTPICA